ncbi:MAG TPA: lipid A biosynthesis acyltransferase [Polyangia bacterium]|jgi:predicted LPLAT superfamily acyltransferase
MTASDAPATAWLRTSEMGSAFALRLLIAICRLLGRGVTRLLLVPIVFYFVAFAPQARRASRDYLRRVGRPHGFRAVFAHCLCFAHVTLDRLFFVLGRYQPFTITRNGKEQLAALKQQRRGALLVGAHVGSFEALRAMATEEELPLNIVGYFRNARLINGVLAKLNPVLATRVINVEQSMSFVLAVKERIDAGEMVALLGDRVGIGDRVVEVDLFGAPALLPAGPYWLAASLHCPVYLTFGLFHEPNRYDLYCEPFAERIELRRGEREADARAWAQRFAQRLEHYCGLAPDNWFNFYPFWKTAEAAA